MTSNNSSSKSFLRHRIRSHWYLSLISSILFFLSGPFVLLISFNQTKNHSLSDTLREDMFNMATSFFQQNEILVIYVMAYILATIIGLILFSYLNSKNQINFYHSQPLSRKKLFASNYFAALFLGLIPLVIMVLFAAIIAISTVGVGSYLSTLPMHILGLTAFYATGLSITALACQLTGSTIFAMFAMGFLNFFASAIIFLATNLISELSATMYFSGDFISYTSPVIYFVLNIIGTSATFSISQICLYSLLAIVVAILAYMLYLVRPSEATGNTIIYKPIGGFIKYVSAFVLATTLGFVFADTGGGFSVYVMVFAGFLFLSCLFMEVAFRRSFKNMKTILPSSILATIIAVGGLYGLSAFSHHLDTKVPDANKVKTMTFDFGNQYINQYGYKNISMPQINDPVLIEEAINIINKIVSKSNYDLNAHELNRTVQPLTTTPDRSTSVAVIYNNSPIKRTYYNVNADLLMDELSSIYDNPKYKASLLSTINNAIAQGQQLSSVYFDTNMVDGYVVRYNYDSPRKSGDFLQDDKYIQPLTDAIFKDITEAKYSDLVRGNDRYGSLSLSYRDFDDDQNYIYLDVQLFENYVNIKKVIAQMIADPDYSQFVSIDTNFKGNQDIVSVPTSETTENQK